MAKTIKVGEKEVTVNEQNQVLDGEGNLTGEKIVDDKIVKEEPPKKEEHDKTVTVKIEVPRVDPEKTYSAEEAEKLVKEAVKAASVNTKNQLQENITKLEGKVTELEKLKKSSSTDSSKEAELTGEISALKETVSALEEGFVSEREKSVTLENQIKKDKLDAVRDGVIAEAKGRIIPELVFGSTEEEIRESAKKAVERYDEIWKNQATKLGLPEEAIKAAGKDQQKSNEPEVKKIERVDFNQASLNDWKTKREAIKKDIRNELGINQ